MACNIVDVVEWAGWVYNIAIKMSYFSGVFVSQYHKSRAGYYINHDLLMHGTSSVMQPHPMPKENLSSTTSPKILPKSCRPLTSSNTTVKGEK